MSTMPKCSDVATYLTLSLPTIRAMLPSALVAEGSLAAVDRHGKAWRFRINYRPASGFGIYAAQFIREHRQGMGDVVALFRVQVWWVLGCMDDAEAIHWHAPDPATSSLGLSMFQDGGLFIDYNTPQVLAAWEAQQRRFPAGMRAQASPVPQAQVPPPPPPPRQGEAIVAKKITRR